MIGETLQMLLHGLAYFGVWLLNVLIYECIAIVIWIAVSYGTYRSPRISERTSDDISSMLAIIFLILLFVIAILICCFSWIRIVPMPVFN